MAGLSAAHAQPTAAAAVQAVVAASCRRVLQIPPAVRRPEEVAALAELLQALEVGARCCLVPACQHHAAGHLMAMLAAGCRCLLLLLVPLQ
jgi:hypothetical protein